MFNTSINTISLKRGACYFTLLITPVWYWSRAVVVLPEPVPERQLHFVDPATQKVLGEQVEGGGGDGDASSGDVNGGNHNDNKGKTKIGV